MIWKGCGERKSWKWGLEVLSELSDVASVGSFDHIFTHKLSPKDPVQAEPFCFSSTFN